MSGIEAAIQPPRFELRRSKALRSGEMIYFDLSKISDDPYEFMDMFKLGSDVFGLNHELLQKISKPRSLRSWLRSIASSESPTMRKVVRKLKALS